jgi:membrane fusion protein (multidrug efflux system)
MAIWKFIATLIVSLGVGLSGCAKKTAPPPASADVEAVSVEQKDVPLYGEWVATLDGNENAEIQPQVTGYLLKRNYTEGTLVKKGQVLFEIDARPFVATLEQAKSNLAQAQAGLSKTTMDVERDTPLATQSAIPQAQLDNDIQAKAAAKAQVDAAKAQVQQAELNVGWTKVRSLVDGIAGFSKAQIGDLVGPTVVLTTVSTVDPIKAYFSLSDQEYIRYANVISAAAEGRLTEVQLRQKRNLELILSDGSTHPSKGWLVVADRQVDVKTGTIRMAGAFENPGGLLRPGQFARLRVQTALAQGALLVPQRSVMEIQGTYQVTVVSAEKKAEIRPVKVGERVGSLWIITAGLKPGEQVVVEGIQKARAGTPLNVKPWTPPTTEGGL